MRGLIITLILFFYSTVLFSQESEKNQLFIKLKSASYYSNEYVSKEILNGLNYKKIDHAFKSKEMQSVFLLTTNENQNLEELITILSKNNLVEYAEKVPIYKLFYTPNDALYSTQWNLAKIDATNAWNIHQGSASVNIAITDDAFLLNHVDLNSKWYINPNEIPANGIDDDNNGYIDDWKGWDAADNDNNTMPLNPTNNYFSHGTHVAGIAGAATNNNLGIASLCANCKLIPVKIGTNSNGSLTGAYQGLDYAINATNAKVINMSWGGNLNSNTYQILFNIAKSKGIVCVAAAGNSSNSQLKYPASYNNVISVASSDSTDVLSWYTSYGPAVDVTAPGRDIMSTLAGSTTSYGKQSGTSMASPLVASLCGLMISNNPSLIPDSVEACLKRTCDNINAQNSSKIGQFGAGRINAYQALLCTQKAPIADFTTNIQTQCINQPIQFIDKSAGVAPLTYSWSFPGGTPSTSTLASPTITYSTLGSKSASLTVTNSFGTHSKTITNIVTIQTPTATLNNYKYTSYNANAVNIAVNFTGNPPYSVTITDGTNNFTKTNIQSNPYLFSLTPIKDTSLLAILSFTDSLCTGTVNGMDTVIKITSGGGGINCFDSTIYYSDTSNWYYQASNGSWLKATLGINNCGQVNHAWSPINLIGIQNGNQMIWGNTSNATSNLKRDILISDVSKIDSIRVLVQADDNIVAFKVNGNLVTSTPFGWNNISSLLVNKSLLINGTNTFNIEGTNANGGCTWVAMKMIIYKDTCAGTPQPPPCDTSTLDNGLVLHLPFNGNTNDASGNSNHATNYGATLTTGKDGIANTAYRFNGMGNYMKVNYHSSLSPNSISICAIIKPKGYFQGTCKNNVIINKGNTENGTGWYSLRYTPKEIGTCISQDTNNCKAVSYFNNGNCVGPISNNSDTIKKDNWYCIITTYDGDTQKMYINGKLQYSCKLNVALGTNTHDLLIGSFNNFYHMNAEVDDIRVYNRAINPTEVNAMCGTCDITTPTSCDTSTLDNGLIAYYPLDGNANDLSGFNHHGTAYGGLQYIAGKKGLAANYDGVDDYINLNAKILENKNNFSLTGWVYLNQTIPYPKYFNIYRENIQGWNGSGLDVTIGAPSSNKHIFQASWSSYLGVSMQNHVVVDHTIDSGKWYCFSITRNSGFLSLYLNGKHIQTVLDSFTTTPLSNGILGGWFYNNDPNHQSYSKGYLDEIRFYNRSLDTNEIKAFCGTCNITPPASCDTSGLILCMSMNSNANDSSNYNNQGNIIGGVINTTDRFGNQNAALNLNGTNGYIEIPNSTSLQLTNELTFSLWINQNTTSSQGSRILDKIYTTTGDGYLFDNYGSPTNSTYRGRMTRFIGKDINWNSNSRPYSLNTWVHIAVTHKNGKVTYYTNGVKDTSYSHTQTTLNTNTLPLRIGTSNVLSNFYNGSMDDLKIYNRALDSSEILNLFSTPFTCKCQITIPTPPPCDTSTLDNGLVLHLPFNGNTNDASGNNNHATNYGATLTTGKDGTANTAYKFNGSSNYMVVANSTSLNPDTSITISAILKPEGYFPLALKANNILTKGADAGNPGSYNLRFTNDITPYSLDTNYFFYGQFINDGSTSYYNSLMDVAPYIELNKWYCLVYTFNGDSCKLYINGNLKWKFKSNVNQMGVGTDLISIGKSLHSNVNAQYLLNATIDDIRIYNRAITSDEVKAYCGTCNSTINPCPTIFSKYTLTKCETDTLILTAQNGSNYTWSPASSLSNNKIKNPKCFAKSSTKYLVMYVDSLNCQHIDTFEIKVNKLSNYLPISDQLICAGDTTQITIPIFATNVLWTPNIDINNTTISNPLVYPIANQEYTLVFKDTFECIHNDTVLISTKKCCSDRAFFTVSNSILCHPDSIKITNTSRFNPTPNFNWTFGAANPSSFVGFQPPKILLGNAMTYPITLIVSNAFCSDTMTQNVYVLNIQADAGKDTTFCTASILNYPIGSSGLSDWKYTWTPSIGLNDPKSSNPILNTSISNDYILEVYDPSSGCYAYDTVKIHLKDKLDTFRIKDSICSGKEYDFFNQKLNKNGIYTHIVKDSKGCDVSIYILDFHIIPPKMVQTSDLIICYQFIDNYGKIYTDTFILYDTIKASTGCDSFIYFKHINIVKRYVKNIFKSGCNRVYYRNQYYYNSVSKIDSIIHRDNNSPICDTLIEYINLVVNKDTSKLQIVANIENPVLYSQNILLTAKGKNNYIWNNGQKLDQLEYRAWKDSTLYVIGYNDSTCKDTVYYTVKIMNENYLDIPNAFSPNGDMVNDVFKPNFKGDVKILYFAIFNRWGEKLYEGSGNNVGWDGTYKGDMVPIGTYVYMLDYKISGRINDKKGSFVLIK